MERFWFEHSYLLYLAVLGLFFICSYLLRRMFRIHEDNMTKICSSVSDLYDKYNNHETRLAHIEGEHKVFTARGVH